MPRKADQPLAGHLSRRSFLQGSTAALAACSSPDPTAEQATTGGQPGAGGGAPTPAAPEAQTGDGLAGSGVTGGASSTGGASGDLATPNIGGDTALGGQAVAEGGGQADPPPDEAPEPLPETALPQRMFGRDAQVPVSILGLGGWPLGQNSVSGDEAQQLWNLAIDEGINYLDTAQNYGSSHDRMREVLQDRRSEVVVVTKISSSVTMQAIEGILRDLGIDYLDGLHLHNFGGRSWGDGLDVLRQAKAEGLIRNIGLSGHENAEAFIPAIETGDIDLVMNPLNFVDRNAYVFESEVRAAAKRHGTNVVAMKVWGGPENWQGARTLVNASFADFIDDGLRYSLGIEDVVSAVIGIKNQDELMQAIEVARGFTPLAPDRLESLLVTGQMLSTPRGRFFG